MNEFKELFIRLVNRSGLSPAQISRETDYLGRKVAESSISSALSGKRALSVELIKAVAPVLKMSREEVEQLTLFAFAFREDGDAKNTVLQIAEKLKGNGTLTPIKTTVKTEVPVWSNIQAGSSDLSDNTATVAGVTAMTETEIREGYFCMLVSGDSMKDEFIFDGDIGIFAPVKDQTVNEHDVYAVEVEGFATWMIKKIRRMPGERIGLISANDEKEPIIINPDVSRIFIKGRLVRNIRERGKSFKL